MQTGALQRNLPLDYFLLVFLLAVPFWLIGGSKLPLPVNLPASALSAFVPMIAAALLSFRQSGFRGVKVLLQRAWDFKRTRSRVWYLLSVILAPVIYFLSFVVMRLTGSPLPDPRVPVLMAPVFFGIYFVPTAGEELGWSGYATDPIQNRWGALKASILLGVVWAIWHAIPFLQTGHSPTWVLWQSLKTIAMRIVIVDIYNRTGKSVLAANLYHTADNVCWSLFPNYSSHYDPFITGVLTWLAAAIIAFQGRNKGHG